jgi:hypothetical protein
VTAKFDAWSRDANKHLLRHITKRLAENSRAYGVPKSIDHLGKVEILVRFKNAWLDEMRRESVMATDGGVPIEKQKAVWVECMTEAEKSIAGLNTEETNT